MSTKKKPTKRPLAVDLDRPCPSLVCGGRVRVPVVPVDVLAGAVRLFAPAHDGESS